MPAASGRRALPTGHPEQRCALFAGQQAAGQHGVAVAHGEHSVRVEFSQDLFELLQHLACL